MGKVPAKTPKKLGMKVGFYFLSLWFLFLVIPFLTAEPSDPKAQGNIIAGVSILCLLVCIIIFRHFRTITLGTMNKPTTPPNIILIENADFEHLAFLTTYIIPFAFLELSSLRYVAVLVLSLLVIGCIFIRTGHYYGNPTLALLGYHLYRAEIRENHQTIKVMLITRDTLTEESSFSWIELDTNIRFARVCENGKCVNVQTEEE